MSFTQFNLHPQISKAIDSCGYTTPTPVQIQSIPPILEGKDVVVCAQTGTGKTAAFVLPLLHRLHTNSGNPKPRILVLTPTRELANQIKQATSTYGKFLKFKIANLVGGASYHQQIRDLKNNPHIIVATPGRLIDHLENKRIDLSQIETLVLDEADRMLDMGFIQDVQFIAKCTPANRQTLLFSATVDQALTKIVQHLLKNQIHIDLSKKEISSPLIEQIFYKSQHQQHKMQLLKHLLKNENIFKAIIFSATKINAEKMAHQLSHDGFSAASLHGDLKQRVRERTVEQLKRGKIQFLVATDVAARGIDISDVTHVINYDLPKFSEDYVHRIGRTGRAGKSGIAISFVLPAEYRHLQRIERYTGRKIKLLSVDLPNIKTEDTHTTYVSDANQHKKRQKKKSFHTDKDNSQKKRFTHSSSNTKNKDKFKKKPTKKFNHQHKKRNKTSDTFE